jgi:hypothetical protein
MPWLGNSHCASAPSGDDGEGQPDTQQPHDPSEVVAHLTERDACSVGEQHPHQGDLDEGLQRLCHRRRIDEARGGEQPTDGDEDDRRGQVRALETTGNDAPQEQHHRDQQDRRCPPVRSSGL